VLALKDAGRIGVIVCLAGGTKEPTCQKISYVMRASSYLHIGVLATNLGVGLGTTLGAGTGVFLAGGPDAALVAVFLEGGRIGDLVGVFLGFS